MIAIDHRAVAKMVRRKHVGTLAATRSGIVRGAMRGRALLQRKTPKDQGQAKASWRFVSVPDGSVVAQWWNDAPHAGILEEGARPHNVNPEGWHAIYRWVERNRSLFFVRRNFVGPLGQGQKRKIAAKTFIGPLKPFQGRDPQISEITDGIVRKIAKYGQKPTFFVKNSLDSLASFARQEVNRAIEEEAKKARTP